MVSRVKLDTSKPFLFDYKAAVGVSGLVMKEAKKKSGVGLVKKRKGGVLKGANIAGGASTLLNAYLVGKSVGSDTGNTTESESVNMEEEYLVEKTSFQLGSGDESSFNDVNMTSKGPKVVMKRILEKPLSKIDFGVMMMMM
ncbi:hypothetical protein G9A89_010820 [Geosiphon pyriformis]|nr:hypothetical protein G9A89_010820 [Geosiphon pyriformis]